MAVAKVGNMITITTAADAVTGKMIVASVTLDHTAAANAVLQNTATTPVIGLRTTSSKLTEQVVFPEGLMMDGLIASTLSAGTLYVQLMQE